MTMSLMPSGAFSTFNREERGAVAILFAALLHRPNLERFGQLADWELGTDETEVFVEWTYLRDLWAAHPGANAAKRTAVLNALEPNNRAWLERCTIEEFNRYFCPTGPSVRNDIYYPGKWSVRGLSETLTDDGEFRRTCRFKWAFNVKPDLVLMTNGRVLCIEAKWDSGEGAYPANEAEKKIFRDRGLDSVSQTEVQLYLVNELLGFDGSFRYLVRGGRARSDSHPTITWGEVLGQLDFTPFPSFVQQWARAELA
jgi:hypothetical protein